MANRVAKALQSIVFEGNFHRISQILMKSPLTHFSAFLHGLISPRIRLSRARVAQEIHLTSEQKRILTDLNENGFAFIDSVFSAEDLSPLENYLSEKLNQIEVAKSNQLSTHKDFWVRLSDVDFSQGTTTDHPLVHLSLKEDLLKIVAKYLKSAPYLEYILLTHSVPSQQPLKSSQLWHQDHDNNRMLKLFFYLSDVESEADGPFTLLPKKANSQIRNSFFPRHLPDSDVDAQFSLSQAVRIKGKKFKAFLVDTSVCYHMGSRVAEGHSRLMSTSLYVTLPKSFWGPLKTFVRPTKPVSSLQKLAIECTGHS